jgi:Spy/CpxP family protein refolding chaperone
MKRANILSMAIIFLVSGIAYTTYSLADPEHPSGYGDHHMGMHGDWSGHGFGGYCHDDSWKSDLSDNQQKEVQKARLGYLKKKDLIKAKLKQAKVEFATLLTEDSPSHSAINKKIDEISKLDSEKLRAKADYKIQIRKILNADQRVKFDMALMKKATSGKQGFRHGHRW